MKNLRQFVNLRAYQVFTLCLCFKTSLSADLSYENERHLHENEPVGGTLTFSYD